MILALMKHKVGWWCRELQSTEMEQWETRTLHGVTREIPFQEMIFKLSSKMSILGRTGLRVLKMCYILKTKMTTKANAVGTQDARKKGQSQARRT